MKHDPSKHKPFYQFKSLSYKSSVAVWCAANGIRHACASLLPEMPRTTYGYLKARGEWYASTMGDEKKNWELYKNW